MHAKGRPHPRKASTNQQSDECTTACATSYKCNILPTAPTVDVFVKVRDKNHTCAASNLVRNIMQHVQDHTCATSYIMRNIIHHLRLMSSRRCVANADLRFTTDAAAIDAGRRGEAPAYWLVGRLFDWLVGWLMY